MKPDTTCKTEEYDIFLFESYRNMTSPKTKRRGGRYHSTLKVPLVKKVDGYNIAMQWGSLQGFKGWNAKSEGRNQKKSTFYYTVRFYNASVHPWGLPVAEEARIAFLRITRKVQE